jgi:glycosyltransferase involved in cell wall biosynthesis
LKICLISVEIFAWGKYGGFGRATRTIGRELARRGIEVHAVVPRRNEQGPIEQLDGITVHGFSPWRPWEAKTLLRDIDADIYHSCEPSMATYYAQRVCPHRKHMVTVRDPRDIRDWWMEFVKPSLGYLQVIHNYLYENNPLVRSTMTRMDAIYTIGKCLVPKVDRIYRCNVTPEFLPTPVAVPTAYSKSSTPTVCYMARLDRRKRPELFLSLAEKFPDVQFIAAGKSRDTKYDQHLREKYASLSNLEMTGFIDQFSSDRHAEILEESWIMVNTATREALPNSFIEAMSRGCAILSAVNPDDVASEFGYHVTDDDFVAGLNILLTEERWKARGRKGYEYALDTFETSHAIGRHIEIYERLVNNHSGNQRERLTI